MTMFMREAHELQPGQAFSFTQEDGPYWVEAISIVGNDGVEEFFYYDGGWHAHPYDHTLVWVEAEQ